MYDERVQHLLAQVPLTVSPFVSLPTATTLPYTYKALPTSIPPSMVDEQRYVVSSTGHAAHPEEIIAQCQTLQANIKQRREDAQKQVKEWEEVISSRDRVIKVERPTAGTTLTPGTDIERLFSK